MDEAQIIKRAQDGDLNAFSELVGSYKKLLYNLCLRMLGDRGEAEEAAQEAFVKIYKGIKTYKPGSKFSTWAIRITSNLCIDIIRKRKMQTVPIDELNIADSSSPEENYLERETKEAVRKAVDALPEKYRIMIIYYHFMNLSYAEISGMLNEPMTIVKNRLYRARRMLRDNLLKGEEGYDELQKSL